MTKNNAARTRRRAEERARREAAGLPARRPPIKGPAECGTDAGYSRHVRGGKTFPKTEPCDACRAAHARALKDRRARDGRPSRAAGGGGLVARRRERGYGDGLDERARRVRLMRELGILP